MSISADEFDCPLPADTEALAEGLARELKAGDVLLLRGALGAGKTCFVRGLARGLGHPEGAVLSPTFQLVRESHAGRLPLYHVDLYRLSEGDAVRRLGLDEYFEGEGVCAVEWPERLGRSGPARAWDIALEAREGGVRRVRVARP